MKKSVLLLLTILGATSFASCGPADKPDKPDDPVIDVEETPDGYVDVLPSNIGDSPILHAFCWKFKDIEDNLNTIKENGFKSVQISPVQQPKGGGSSWWSYYQPLSFSIADNSMLGTKEDLISLCASAHSKGISIIADLVCNHLANINDDELESDGTPKVNPDVAKYEPYLYEHRNDSSNPTFHHAPRSGSETQYYSFGQLPDLNTANPKVQERALSLMKECIDVGIDGFRFDTAKHIETSKDSQYPSNFWNNTLLVAKDYYKQKTGKDFFAYGEVLGNPEGRPLSNYLELMNVTADGYVGNIASSLSPTAANAQKIVDASYGKSAKAEQLITWVESHDNYTSSSTHVKTNRLIKTWGVIAGRKGSVPLFLARPNENLEVAKIGDYTFEDARIAAINNFHNRFHDAPEYQKACGNFYINERVNSTGKGAVVVDCESKGTGKVKFDYLGTGVYYDQITGNKVTVRNGEADITFNACGVAVLTMSANKPAVTFNLSSRGGVFASKKEITIEVTNAVTATYKINNEPEVSFTNSAKIQLGDHVGADKKVNIVINANNGTRTYTRELSFSQVELIDGGFNVVNIDPSYFTDYELYMWSWEPGKWSKNYTIKNGVVLVDTKGMTGFLFALFEKGYVVTKTDEWDNNAIKQSADIKGTILTEGFFDASGF